MNIMETEQKPNPISTPAAILIAGVLIAGGVYAGLRADNAPNPSNPQVGVEASAELKNMKAVGADDHIRGNPDAPVKIVEYSDTECPFCKRFHETMKQVTAEDGDQVAWVYRHFPLDSLHTKARSEAVALECANELGGNDAFWAYADRLFAVTPSNDGLDPAELPKIAGYIGLDTAAFTACASSDRYDAHIQSDLDNATATGGNGTPWSIIVGKNGKMYPLSGAQPYESLKQLIELARTGK